MRRTYRTGDKVRLTPSMQAAVSNPDAYREGYVTSDAGIWGVYDIKWSGIDHPIGMRSDEIEFAPTNAGEAGRND